MRLKAIVSVLICCALLAGCTPIESNVENLMQPPKLTDLQYQVDKALREAVGGNFRLKYPSGGKYRSAFNFLDLDGDGVDEAVAFFTDRDDSIQTAILRQDKGSWQMSDIVPPDLSFCTEVDFLATQKLGGSQRVLVGWGGTGLANNLLTIYSYQADPGSQSSLQLDSRWDYSRAVATDMDQNGENELLLLLAPDSYQNTAPLVNLVGENTDGIIDLLAEVSLPRNITAFYPPVVGALGNNQYGAAVDCRLSNGNLCTLTITYAEGDLILPLSVLTDQNLFQKTFRRQEVLSCDLNGDGLVEIPVERLAPGYTEGSDDAVYFIDYSNLQRDSLVAIETAYLNPTRGYRFLFPQRWREQPVSVMVQPDNSETVFFLSPTGDLYDHSEELLKLQVYSTLDGPDKVAQERYFALDTRGTYVYAAALPATPAHELALGKDEVKKLFSFIS